jgi:Tudor domain
MIQCFYRYLGEDEQSINSQLSEAGHGHSVQNHEELWHRAMRVAPRPPDKIAGSTSNIGNSNNTKASANKAISTTTTNTKTVERRNSQAASTGNGSSRSYPMCLEVSVNHVIDPSKFFVRHRPKDYQSQQQILNDIGPQLQKPRSIQIGSLYAVLDTESMQWYRGHCLRLADSATEILYDFYLIDEGRSLQVSSSYVHNLNEELKSSRPMVWECSLYMKKPKNGWVPSLIDLFKRMVARERMKLTVLSAQEGIRRVDLAQIPLYNGEPVVQSVKDALASAIQTEKLANGQPVPPAVPPKPIARKYFSSLTGVKKGSSLHGQVLHIQNPDSFYVRFDESDAQKFSMFDSQLQTEYNAPDARSSYEVGVPQKGISRLTVECLILFIYCCFLS